MPQQRGPAEFVRIETATATSREVLAERILLTMLSDCAWAVLFETPETAESMIKVSVAVADGLIAELQETAA